MFQRLHLRIQVALLTAVLLYIALSSWVVYRTMESRGMESLQRMSVQYTGQQHQNAELFKRWLEETVQIVANREGIGEALSGKRYDESLLPLLDGLRASNVDLSSLVLYGRQGAVYSSGNITSIRNLEQLTDEPEIGRFLRSGTTSEWMALDASLLYYPYGGKARKSLFHFTRITDSNGVLLGVLQFETSLPKLAGFFRSEPGTLYGGNRVYVAAADGQWLDVNGLNAEVSEETDAASVRFSGERLEAEIEGGILLMYALEHSADRIAIVIPNDQMRGELGKLGAILIAVNVAMALLFVLLARRLSLSITVPLTALFRKMRETMKEPSPK